ncbi:cilia- and flagella-associated protein 43-like [Macrobrachium rosenbergii]|uniref:cilia- and flagella-associated protein 43-like n=1 Tax=Macrobrachium rosenbergii TaxID=79674 RepID=UPI0034D5F221
MSESEETFSSPSAFDTFRTGVDHICAQLDKLLEENAALDETHRLPVTDFTVNPQKLIALQESLIQSELKVVRDVERERLDKLLQCHFLKGAAWDEMRVKSKSLFCITKDSCVKNYPIREPDVNGWQKILEAVSFRLREMEGSVGMESPAGKGKRKESSWKKNVASDTSRKPKGLQDLLDTAKSSGRDTTQSGGTGGGDDSSAFNLERDVDGEMCKHLLYPQEELTSREKVERQLVLVKFMTRKLKDAFNARFDGVHQKKGKVIEEVQRLTKRKRQLKEELAAVKKEQRESATQGTKGMSLSVGGTSGGSSRSMSDSGRPASALPEEDDDDGDYDPQWRPEERPELLLDVDDSEISTENVSVDGTKTPSTARAASAAGEADGRRTPQPSSKSPSGGPPSIGSDATWAEARAAFLAGPRPHKSKSAKTPAGPGTKGQDWTWAEARAWREWRAAQEEEQRKRQAHVNTLNLQLERITPTIKNLLQEFDSQVLTLTESRVSTDEALMLYQLVTSRLQRRLYHQEDLQQKLAGLQKQRKEVEVRLSQVEAEAEGSRREEGRAKGRHDRLIEQLKEEEAGLRRTIINLPIDQYNHLLSLYTKRATATVRHLDLPSARGGMTGQPPLTPPGGGPHSPLMSARAENFGSGIRPSRPPSSTSRSGDDQRPDDFRVEDDQMPEGLTGGIRTWRQFLKYRKRRQELLEEAEDASAKKATATANLQAMDAHRQTLLQQAQKVDDAISEVMDELTQLDQDMELVLILRCGQVKLDLDEAMEETLEPCFTDAQLVPVEELDKLESTIQKCGGVDLNGNDAEGAGGGRTEDAEVQALRVLKGQLELQVEIAKKDLHHMNNFKVGKDVMLAAMDVVEGEMKQDSTQLYASLQRLQQLHADRAKDVSSSSDALNRRIDKTRKRVGSLQQEVESLAHEIDELQGKITQAQPEMAVVQRENRLRRIMACNDLAAQTRRRQAAILDLEHELETLRLRTFPMLSRPPATPS